MNFINVSNHPESQLSGSTLETMIDRAKELGWKYFAVSDNGLLTSVLKAHSYAEKKGLKIIPGIELYFKDDDCDIIKNTPSEKMKYSTITIHAKDQESYQKIVKLCSDRNKKQIRIGEQLYYTYTWADLEYLSEFNITASLTNIESMVSKHLLVNRPDLAEKYYQKLKSIFQEDFYPTIVPYKQDKYWNSIVKIDLKYQTIEISANNRVDTDHYIGAQAIDLTKRGNQHKLLKAVYINGVKFPIKEEHQEIIKGKLINTFQDIGDGDLQTTSNKFIIEMATKYGDLDRLLLNSYAYYATKEDKIVQNMKLGDEKRFYQSQFMQSSEDVLEYLVNELNINDINSFYERSATWAEKFKDFSLKYDIRLPAVEGGDPQKILIDIIKKVGRMKWDDPVYLKQFREELNLLTNNGVVNLIPYFLPLVDLYDYYKQNGQLTSVARGSAGGFLISYLIGITHIDPIKYNLSTSRFLTMDRIKQGNYPDIDSDLPNRDLLVGHDGNGGYLKQKYGKKYAQISTRTLLKIKSAILDANRFINNGTVEESIQKLAKSLPNTPQGVNDKEYVFGYEDENGNHHEGLIDKIPELKKYSEERPNEWQLVTRALSLSRQHGRHAAAFVIADRDIEEIVPVFEVGGVHRVTQPEAKQVEAAGLMKYDLLVVSCVKDIQNCLEFINAKNKSQVPTGNFIHNGKETFIWDLPIDQDVFNMLSMGKTETVFQLHSVGPTEVIKKVKPTSIIDLATITSLERPGPKDFVDETTGRNMVEEYIERRFGRSKSDIPILDELIPETYSVITYQEQISKIAKELGQMSVEDAENVRIAMGKKRKKLLESLKPKFIEGAVKRVDPETAEKIWGMMETFARYGFNKCFHKDTVIYKNKNQSKPLTIGEMFRAKNDKNWAKENKKLDVGKKYKNYGYGKGWSKHGDTIHPNEIKDIRFEGIEDVYKITTESGKTVITTDNHKFPTPKGEKMLMDLTIGDELYVNTGYKQESSVYRFNSGNNLPIKGQQGFQKKPNSSFNLFKERSAELKNKHNNCQTCLCDLTNKRKEIHHINGDHGNQDYDNLILLCSSCHKKAHYSMGRSGYGDKGLVVGVEKIKSIEYIGQDEVYDVEMAAPYHNLVVNDGIIASNSHAVAYVVVSYACAFLKYHYPLEWWAAVLSNADSKEINEELYKYVKDMVIPPDVNVSTEKMSIDYNLGKIRNKLSMVSGLGTKASEKIIAGRPYSDIHDFVKKKVCGPSMTKKLIHIGALDSLFDPNLNTYNKIQLYEQAVRQVEFEEKIKIYDQKILKMKLDGDEKGAIKTEALRNKLISKGPAESHIDEFYASLSFKHKLDYLVKKSTFPTINLDLMQVLLKDSKTPIIKKDRVNLIQDRRGKNVILLSGEHLQKIDNTDVDKDITFCVPGYVLKSEIFTYQNNTKKALKLIIDSSGYVSEKVLWPDYNTGILNYPDNLEEGCIAYFIYNKKNGKPYTNIYEIIVDENSIKV